jgi:hypothetical protein
MAGFRVSVRSPKLHRTRVLMIHEYVTQDSFAGDKSVEVISVMPRELASGRVRRGQSFALYVRGHTRNMFLL